MTLWNGDAEFRGATRANGPPRNGKPSSAVIMGGRQKGVHPAVDARKSEFSADSDGGRSVAPVTIQQMGKRTVKFHGPARDGGRHLS